MTNYVFDNAAEREAGQRLANLGAIYDANTMRSLAATGLAPGWHCLEIGAGSGSIGEGLADAVGATGHVLMTDIDPRFLGARNRANLETRRHDIAIDPLADAAFDLIHGRLVLVHVPQRATMIGRLMRALKPGGWLVIEDYDGRIVDCTFATTDPEQRAVAGKCFDAFWATLESHGIDLHWGRSLYDRFVAAGLKNAAMSGHVAVWQGGSPGARVTQANFSQLRPALLSQTQLSAEELDRFHALLDDPSFVFASPMMFTACGQRP